jgi:hypothetical protein
VIVMAGLFPEAVRVGCVAAIVVGAIITRLERDRPGGGWWMLLATGAALSAVGAALAAPEATETAGGIVALAGAVLVVIGATVGFPLRERAG